MNDGKFSSLGANLGPGTDISQLILVPVTSSTKQRFPSGTQNMMLAVGKLNVNGFGNVSAALYDGTTWNPHLLTTRLDGQPGFIYQVIHTTDFNGIKKAHSKFIPIAT